MKAKTRLDYLKRRHRRLRKKIVGTAERPRMCVSISHRHIYVQFIDDRKGFSLIFASTLQDDAFVRLNVAAAKALGKKASELALAKGIRQVVFDRGGHLYNGRVKAIAEAARAAGIKL
jgi:large subunit ribosomal protein L18